MANENVGGKTCSFSQSDFKIFIAKNLDKFARICIFFLIVFTIAKVENLSRYGVITFVFLLIIPYLYGKIQQKFAHTIVVNFDSRNIQLHMHRSDVVITSDFDDIKSIRVNGYIIFDLKERIVFYNDLQNNKLFNCLNKIKKIDWGFLFSIWGPRKNIRNTLTENGRVRMGQDIE